MYVLMTIVNHRKQYYLSPNSRIRLQTEAQAHLLTTYVQAMTSHGSLVIFHFCSHQSIHRSR